MFPLSHTFLDQARAVFDLAEATASSHSVWVGAAPSTFQSTWHRQFFLVCVLPRVLESDFFFFAQSPAALHLLDGALRRWGRHVLGWPPGAPCAGALCEIGWLDAEHLALGRPLSVLGRSFSVAQGPGCPLPATKLSVASQSPGTWAYNALVNPFLPAVGIHPQSSPYRVRRWVDSAVSPALDVALRHRVQASICSLSTTRLPDGATFSVHSGPDVLVYGRGGSPEHARFWGLARWGHDRSLCGRPAQHVGLPSKLQIL